jgi:hypothetical protein
VRKNHIIQKIQKQIGWEGKPTHKQTQTQSCFLTIINRHTDTHKHKVDFLQLLSLIHTCALTKASISSALAFVVGINIVKGNVAKSAIKASRRDDAIVFVVVAVPILLLLLISTCMSLLSLACDEEIDNPSFTKEAELLSIPLLLYLMPPEDDNSANPFVEIICVTTTTTTRIAVKTLLHVAIE